MAAKCESPAATVPGHSLCADLAQACSQGQALPCWSHLGGVSRHSPYALQAEVREGERAADSAADSFHFGGTRILLVWAEGPRRGQEASPPARQPASPGIERQAQQEGRWEGLHLQGRLWKGAGKGHWSVPYHTYLGACCGGWGATIDGHPFPPLSPAAT